MLDIAVEDGYLIPARGDEAHLDARYVLDFADQHVTSAGELLDTDPASAAILAASALSKALQALALAHGYEAAEGLDWKAWLRFAEAAFTFDQTDEALIPTIRHYLDDRDNNELQGLGCDLAQAEPAVEFAEKFVEATRKAVEQESSAAVS
ncbi:hypothetical protein ASF30_10435 [Leifsonia sp. Leaf264]|nr:hypothetical protein ASF30_10435 [Leifsonia sp. Leaf264]